MLLSAHAHVSMALLVFACSPVLQAASPVSAVKHDSSAMGQAALVTSSPAEQGCRVTIEVRRSGGTGELLPAAGDSTATSTVHTGTQALELTIHNPEPRAISSIDALVQLAPARQGLQPLTVTVASGTRPGMQMRMHLVRTIEANGDLTFTWNVRSSRPAEAVSIEQLTYRDGTSWSPSNRTACQFKPDPVTLITQR